MGKGIALWKGDVWDVGWGTLALDDRGVLALRTAEGDARFSLSLNNSAFVDAYATNEWICAVGAADEQVVVGSRKGPQLDVILTVERLEMSPQSAVGGHAVRFHPLLGDDGCLLTWEFGVALVAPESGRTWSHVHGDPEQRLRKLTGQVVELSGLHQALTINLYDGTVTSRPLEHHAGVDSDTLAEWRRGIGR